MSFTSHRRTAAKTSVAISIMVLLGPLGQVLLRKAMRDMPAPATWSLAAVGSRAQEIAGSPTVWVGFACLMMYLLAEMLVLSWADYTYVQPVAASAYGVVAVLGYAMLGEHISTLRWIGVAVICLGVFMVGRTDSRTTGKARA